MLPRSAGYIRLKEPFFSLIAFCVILLTSCGKTDDDKDYRQSMRDFVVRISENARVQDTNFIVIPQNGIQLVTLCDDANAELATSYLAAIDGHGQEDLFYGYENDNEPTPSSVTDELLAYLHRSQQSGNCILVTDYCSKEAYVTDAHVRCDAEGFVSFVAPSRELDVIPTATPPHENANDITKLSDAKNFLYLLNPERFSSKSAFIDAVCATNYDVVIMDLYFDEDTAFTADEVGRMQYKANGGKRLVICYMSIGEAEDYRYYWQPSWSQQVPEWLDGENPSWPGNYKVRYWNSDWQNLICGSGDSYLNRILDAHFDGVYLDIVDAFEYYENI